MQGNLDGAIEEVAPVLALAPERRVATVTAYVDNINRRLSHPQFIGNKRVAELRQQLWEFNSTALLEADLIKESG